MLEKIGNWLIVFMTKEELQNGYNEGKEDFSEVGGYADFFRNTIYVCSDLCNERKLKILRHELTHAMMFEYNIDINEEPIEIGANLVGNYYEEIELINKIAKHICAKKEVIDEKCFITSVVITLREMKEKEK